MAALPAAEAAEKAEPPAPETNDKRERQQTVDEKNAAAWVHGPKPRQTIGSLVQELLMDPKLGYLAIVDRVAVDFPGAKTSVRSVARVAAVMRKKGVEVPMRRKTKR